jgi:glycosyltransferase involved in cell wall biosynthesis
MRPDILVFAPTPLGGLAEYTFHQARALKQLGGNLICLVAGGFLGGRQCPYPIEKCLFSPPSASDTTFIHRCSQGASLIANQLRLAWWVLKLRPKIVLLDSYVEYLSPFWVWPHLLLTRTLGVKYVANLHDPVRSYQIGPTWWHRLSVRLAYSPLHAVLVHSDLPASAKVPTAVRVIQVPHGPYELRPSSAPRNEIRAKLGALPQHRVFLAFGYVRDGKNLDLAIRALTLVPEAILVIAGSVASANDRPFSFYRNLATDLGVADRVKLREGFVSDIDLADYFEGADFILLTYSSEFHSQSGVLNLAALSQKPVLASSAPSPLLTIVRQFSLGVAIPPDSAQEIANGMRQLIQSPPMPRLEEFLLVSSWEANAHQILSLIRTPCPASKTARPA